MIISCANEKGGTGKTSTTALISWELSNMGYKVLMVDCDPQANLTDIMITVVKIEHKKHPPIPVGERHKKGIIV